MHCLAENTILELVQDRLAPPDRAAAERHLDECPDCLRAVAETAKYMFQDGSSQVTVVRSHAPLAPGRSVGRYVIESVIGSGAMGVVYAAYDPQLRRKIALKLLRPDGEDPTSQARLLREAQAMAQLSHPNVVAVHDAGGYEGRVFIAMELIEGRTLAEWLAEQPRAWREIVDALVAAGRGLAAAHSAGLVHRDFKPPNVLIGRDGRVRVTDFGLARAPIELADSGAPSPLTAESLATLTQTGAFAGTPAYMAPEQFARQPADARCDQFSFCVAFYEALWGERPFDGDTILELADSVTTGKLRARPKREVPDWLYAVIVRGLAVDPAQRFASLDALLDEIARGLQPRKRRGVMIAIAAGAATAIAAVVFVAVTWGSSNAESTPPAAKPDRVGVGVGVSVSVSGSSSGSDTGSSAGSGSLTPTLTPTPTPTPDRAPVVSAPLPKKKPVARPPKRKPASPDAPLDPWESKH